MRSIKLTQDLTDDSIVIIGMVPLNEHTHLIDTCVFSTTNENQLPFFLSVRYLMLMILHYTYENLLCNAVGVYKEPNFSTWNHFQLLNFGVVVFFLSSKIINCFFLLSFDEIKQQQKIVSV